MKSIKKIILCILLLTIFFLIGCNEEEDPVAKFRYVPTSETTCSVWVSVNPKYSSPTRYKVFLEIPEAYMGKKVTALDPDSFIQYNESVTSITFGKYVEDISVEALKRCKNLTTVNVSEENEHLTKIDGVIYTKDMKKIVHVDSIVSSCRIQSGVEVIGKYAFVNNHNIMFFAAPSTLKVIEPYAFYECRGLEEINMLDESLLEEIGEYAFYNNLRLKGLKMPTTIKTIGAYAFNKCKYLAAFEILEDSKLEHIGEHAFENAETLAAIYIPESVKFIGQYAFSNCKSLKILKMAEDGLIEKIEDFAFQYTSIEEIIIPKTVKTIGAFAFYMCKELNNIIIPEKSNLEIIKNSAFTGAKITKLIIPSSVKIIEEKAFQSCEMLKTVNVEENSKLQTLGKEVFSYCLRLQTITLPKSLKEIGPNIFFYCQNIKDIVYLGTKEDWNMMKIETPNDNINEDIISFLQ